LGTAFQLVDDLLDYEGRSEELGKNVGDDIREGKATLPILLAMARCTAEEREMLRQAVQSGEVARLGQIIDVVRRTGAIEATRKAAEAEIEQACLNLDRLPRNRARDALLELCSRAVHRSF
jgi:octaprenyl-diphosphate synthase